MENRRVFARRSCRSSVQLSRQPDHGCPGEVRNIGLGGALVWIASDRFEVGDRLLVGPTGHDPLEYEVCWVELSGKGFELGLKFPHPMALFWQSWAADLLAGERPTQSEVLERRTKVRLECLLEASLETEGDKFVVDVLDIGGGGALIEMDTRLSESNAMKLTILTPVRVGSIPCQIARSWPGEPVLYGIEFVDQRERHRVGLLRLIEHLFRQRP